MNDNNKQRSMVGLIGGLAVGACVSYATRGLLDGALPEATSTFEKVVRAGALYGGSLVAGSMASEAVANQIDNMLTMPSMLLGAYNNSAQQVAELNQK